MLYTLLLNDIMRERSARETRSWSGKLKLLDSSSLQKLFTVRDVQAATAEKGMQMAEETQNPERHRLSHGPRVLPGSPIPLSISRHWGLHPMKCSALEM